jgi:hypothetical protein
VPASGRRAPRADYCLCAAPVAASYAESVSAGTHLPCAVVRTVAAPSHAAGCGRGLGAAVRRHPSGRREQTPKSPRQPALMLGGTFTNPLQMGTLVQTGDGKDARRLAQARTAGGFLGVGLAIARSTAKLSVPLAAPRPGRRRLRPRSVAPPGPDVRGVEARRADEERAYSAPAGYGARARRQPSRGTAPGWSLSSIPRGRRWSRNRAPG